MYAICLGNAPLDLDATAPPSDGCSFCLRHDAEDRDAGFKSSQLPQPRTFVSDEAGVWRPLGNSSNPFGKEARQQVLQGESHDPR